MDSPAGSPAPSGLVIAEESAATLAEYAAVPIAFEVRAVYEVAAAERGLGGLPMTLRPLATPYVKDYDADPASHPTGWGERFDVARWGVLAARVGGRRVGGAAVAFGSADVELLEGRSDLAVLWDLRVAPAERGVGVGTALLRGVEAWARVRGARRIRVETQNVNVWACRFYARHGYTLGAVHRFAYPSHPGETQLLWYRDLGDRGA